MIIQKDFLALKDVAEISNTSSSNVSNWRARDSRFPIPYTDTSAGPLWKTEDIVAYLNTKFKDEYDAIATGNILSKRVAVIGRARVGKSFIISRFVLDREGFAALFCGNSKDKTACPIYVKVSEYVQLESFVFHTNFNSIYNGEEKQDDDLKMLNKEISQLIGKSYQQDDVKAMEHMEEVHADMAAYTTLFEDLKGNIISTDIDILDPAGHCIAFPTMNKVRGSLQEELFLEDVKKKMIEAFIPENEMQLDTNFKKLINENGEKARDLVVKLMADIPVHAIGESESVFSNESVIEAKHDRVMTKDQGRIHNALHIAYTLESKKLYDYFSSFTASDYPEEWQQAIKKLEIIKECLIEKKVSNRKEMVLCRYIGGLRKIAEY